MAAGSTQNFHAFFSRDTFSAFGDPGPGDSGPPGLDLMSCRVKSYVSPGSLIRSRAEGGGQQIPEDMPFGFRLACSPAGASVLEWSLYAWLEVTPRSDIEAWGRLSGCCLG